MLKLIKIKGHYLIKAIANLFGIRIKMSSEERFVKLLNHYKIDLILDVGANTGQFARMCFALGYKGNIISFEPLKSAYETLIKKAAKKSKWEVAERMALGDENKVSEINVSENSMSSSLLSMREEHVQAMPESKYVNKEKIFVKRLDDVFKDIKGDYRNVFLKVDTQGYEDAILKGATESLKHIKGIQLETSLVQLYENEKLLPFFLEKMEKMGYRLEYIEPGFSNVKTGQVLQADCIFFK